MSANRISDVGYQSRLRGKYPVQITVAIKEAVEDGLIFFKNRSGGILTVNTVPEYIGKMDRNTRSFLNLISSNRSS